MVYPPPPTGSPAVAGAIVTGVRSGATLPAGMPPLAVPALPPAGVVLYEGQALTGFVAPVPTTVPGAQHIHNASMPAAQWGTTPTAAFTEQAPQVGNTVLVALVWQGTATVATPAGWALDASAGTAPGMQIALFRRVIAAGDGDTFPFPATGATSTSAWLVLGMEAAGILATSPVDRTATAATVFNRSTTVTAPGANAQANEMVLTVGAYNTVNAGDPDAGTGYLPINGGQNGITAGLFARPLTYTTTASATYTGVYSAVDWLGLLVTYKGEASPVLFKRIGQLELATGQAVARGAALGEMELHVPLADPLARRLVENTIVEWRVPDVIPGSPPTLNLWTHGYYLVREISYDETGPRPATIVTARGRDLRELIAGREVAGGVVEAARGSPPANKAIENWVRAYINAACITVSAGNTYPNEPIPTLRLEATSGNRGTVYPNPPANAGAPLGETITKVLDVDGIAWRVVLLGAGTTTAALEVQMYQGTDRRMGQAGQAVFATHRDTATRVQTTRTAIDRVNELTVLTAPPDSTPTIRGKVFVDDAASKAAWGPISGQRDARTEQTPDSLTARIYLDQVKPTAFARVEPRMAPWCVLGRHYQLMDPVTVLAREGRERYDGPITTLTVQLGPQYGTSADLGNVPGYEYAEPAAVGVEGPTPDWFGMAMRVHFVVGRDPELAVPARDSRPADLGDYTDLSGMTSTVAELDILHGVTVTASDINNTAGIEAAATHNPMATAATTFDTVGTQTVAAVGAPTDLAAQVASAAPATLPAAVDRTELNTILDALVTYINAQLAARFGNAAGTTSATTAVNNVQGTAAQHATAAATLLARLQTARILPP